MGVCLESSGCVVKIEGLNGNECWGAMIAASGQQHQFIVPARNVSAFAELYVEILLC